MTRATASSVTSSGPEKESQNPPEDEWGTDAEKLFKFLGTTVRSEDKKREIKAVQLRFFEEPLKPHTERLAASCKLDAHTLALAAASIVVWGDGSEQLPTVAGFLGAYHEKLSTTVIREHIFALFYLHENITEI